MLDQVEIFHGLSGDELAALEHSSTYRDVFKKYGRYSGE